MVGVTDYKYRTEGAPRGTTDEVAVPSPGAVCEDRGKDTRPTVVVVDVVDQRADDFRVDGRRLDQFGSNQPFRPDAPVVRGVYTSQLHRGHRERLERSTSPRETQRVVRGILADDDVEVYAFPADRLRQVDDQPHPDAGGST